MDIEPIQKTKIPAEPTSITIDVSKTALIIVDMQNAFVRKGAYFDLSGYDISRTERIIPACQSVIQTAREKGITVIYLQMIRDRPSPGDPPAVSPSFQKSRIPALVKERPDMADKIFFECAWGSEIIDELMPYKTDIIIKKRKYDGFLETDLESRLKTLGIQYLLFIGTATNVCVESTLRHAFFLDYFCILVSDAVSQMGPEIIQESTITNVRTTFGWVTHSKDLLNALRAQ